MNMQLLIWPHAGVLKASEPEVPKSPITLFGHFGGLPRLEALGDSFRTFWASRAQRGARTTVWCQQDRNPGCGQTLEKSNVEKVPLWTQ